MNQETVISKGTYRQDLDGIPLKLISYLNLTVKQHVFKLFSLIKGEIRVYENILSSYNLYTLIDIDVTNTNNPLLLIANIILNHVSVIHLSFSLFPS